MSRNSAEESVKNAKQGRHWKTRKTQEDARDRKEIARDRKKTAGRHRETQGIE